MSQLKLDESVFTDFDDPVLSSPSSFSSKHEIIIPYSTIELDPSIEGSTGSLPKKVLSDDRDRYAIIDYQTESTAVPITEQPKPTKQPSRYHTTKAKHLLPAPSKRTRQKSFAIGEEWEDFHQRKSESCPTTPISGRKNRGNLYAIDNPNYTGSETDRTDGSQAGSPRKEIDALPFHYFFSMPSNVWKANQILPNPYNKRNHQFHSTLHCPCFFFFFFICCLPGVYLMQRSDKKFKKGQSLEAKKYGRLSTIMFVLGSIAGVVFLGVAIYFAASYVRQFVD